MLRFIIGIFVLFWIGAVEGATLVGKLQVADEESSGGEIGLRLIGTDGEFVVCKLSNPLKDKAPEWDNPTSLTLCVWNAAGEFAYRLDLADRVARLCKVRLGGGRLAVLSNFVWLQLRRISDGGIVRESFPGILGYLNAVISITDVFLDGRFLWVVDAISYVDTAHSGFGVVGCFDLVSGDLVTTVGNPYRVPNQRIVDSVLSKPGGERLALGIPLWGYFEPVRIKRNRFAVDGMRMEVKSAGVTDLQKAVAVDGKVLLFGQDLGGTPKDGALVFDWKGRLRRFIWDDSGQLDSGLGASVGIGGKVYYLGAPRWVGGGQVRLYDKKKFGYAGFISCPEDGGQLFGRDLGVSNGVIAVGGVDGGGRSVVWIFRE